MFKISYHLSMTLCFQSPFQLINKPWICYFIHKVHQVPTILVLSIDCASKISLWVLFKRYRISQGPIPKNCDFLGLEMKLEIFLLGRVENHWPKR